MTWSKTPEYCINKPALYGTPHRAAVDLHTDIVSPATHEALEYLRGSQWLKKTQWYLAGGTALALHVGHRQSVDLDFFTPQKDFAAGKLVSHFDTASWHANIIREGTVYGTLRGAKISFIAYPFFVPKQPYHWYGAVRILDPRDIAVMKVIAISQRGRKRDFLDLYWCAQHLEPLAEIIKKLPEQYPGIAHNFHHIIKSLAYFGDAESDPMPTLFFKANWKEIRNYFKREAPQVARALLELDPVPFLHN